MVRVIVIIICGSAGIGGFLLFAFGVVFLIKAEKFANDGDAAPNTTNVVRSSMSGFPFAPCYPSVDSYLESNRMLLERRGRVGSREELETIRNRAEFKWVDEGSRVRVTEERKTGSAPHWLIPSKTYTLVRVASESDAFESCFMAPGSLEMKLFEWIKWKVRQ